MIVGGTLVLFWGLAMMVYGSLVELNADMPRLIDRARGIVEAVRAYGRAHLPPGLVDASPKAGGAESQGWDSVRSSMRILASNAAGMLAEAFVVGVYLVFLLLEARRFPRRIRAGFEPGRAEAVLGVVRGSMRRRSAISGPRPWRAWWSRSPRRSSCGPSGSGIR